MKHRMIHLTSVLLAAMVCAAPLCAQPALSRLRAGDILFQTSQSRQSLAIQTATHSKYSHVGIVLEHGGRLMVLEAVQPVKFTELSTWVRAGHGGHFEARRLRDPKVLDAAALAVMDSLARAWVGRDYDLHFGWSDQQLYCSELVWKLYHHATGMDLGALKPLGSFDLTHPLVQAKLRERYGDDIPYDEAMIAPGDILEAAALVGVE